MTEEPQSELQRDDFRRFDIGETISRAFRLLKSRFWDALKLGSLLILGPSVIVNASEYLLTSDPDALTAILVLFGVVMLIAGSVFLSIGLIIIYVRELWGERVEIGDAVRQGSPRFWPYLGAYILAALGFIAGFLALIVPAFILLCGWYVVAPVVVGEKLGVTESLGRSWQLSSGHKWPIFVVIIVYLIAAVVIGGLMGAVAGPFVGLDAVMKASTANLSNVLIFSLVESLAGVLSAIVSMAIIASVYHELLYLNREID